MKLLSPTQHKRLNEVTGFLLLSLGLVTLLSLVSYHVQDPSWDTASSARPLNLIGYPGSYLADLSFQIFGAAALLFPFFTFVLAWKWIRSEAVEAGTVKVIGSLLLTLSLCAALSFAPWRIFAGTIRLGGTLGYVLASWLVNSLNVAGAIVATGTTVIVARVPGFDLHPGETGSMVRRPAGMVRPPAGRLAGVARTRAGAVSGEGSRAQPEAHGGRGPGSGDAAKQEEGSDRAGAGTGAGTRAGRCRAEPGDQTPPWQTEEEPVENEFAELHEIPICQVEDLPPVPPPVPVPVAAPAPPPPQRAHLFQLPATELLNEIPGRNAYDEQELKDIAAKIKSKFEEFNVLGNVVQINPGPVVTTFEFKPDAGMKYSRIINLTEDLCLGLQAESILIERIPGKPTVGIEVPNTRRELIALRQMLESDEFGQSHSHLTIPLGKDINGRIRVASLETMPHLLIAGSTGSGKSVMINSMIMSIMYKATPDDVRMIMVDPKRVELGMYEGIPHLLTPVITDPKKATNALRNAVLEMERRLRLLAEYGCRNIDQFNKKIRKIQDVPRSLFDEQEQTQDEVKSLPYILILIDELADLMMIEGKNVEESVTRLAQMARAVGMHLVLATQRPSVDVITGLIKANFPSRISFRVATRVDSRTVLDVMGAEHLLGKGDMLFLPPGSSRLTRVHGAFVTETEINRVVDFWKQQAKPDYDQSFLIAPPSDDDAAGEGEPVNEDQDPMYEEAVRLVLQMGKASTSTLQRHLRLGYGRAARILDMMQRDGIIGAPDGSKPREVLKRPDWLREVEDVR